MLTYKPAVFAVERNYQILALTQAPCLFWVEVDGQEYYDESNGILRSLTDLHRVNVPMDVLDRAGSYRVCMRPMQERKAYFSRTGDVQVREFPFRKLPDKNIRAYHISDAHNRVEEPVRAAAAFGPIDLLILNGDLLSHCDEPKEFSKIYRLAEELTGGEIPILFSRGNHDMRGLYAEDFARYTPNDRGNTYYTFRLGSLWGVILDCGEDKEDSHEEYGHTVACHALRQRQKAMLENLLRHAGEEFDAPGVQYRLVVCHMPFSRHYEAPFDIEYPMYREWCSLLADMKPDVMICGHTHTLGLHPQGGEWDQLGQPCTIVSGGKPEEGSFAGCGYVFEEDGIRAVFTDSNGCVLGEERVL